MCFKQPLKEWATGRKDHPVSVDTFILTSQGDIGEVTVASEFSKRCLQVLLEIIPLQTQLIILPVHGLNVSGVLESPFA